MAKHSVLLQALQRVMQLPEQVPGLVAMLPRKQKPQQMLQQMR